MTSTPAERLASAFPWLFAHLDDDDIAAFVARLEPRRFAAGDVLIRHGALSDTLYLLPEGGVEVSLGAADRVIDLSRGVTVKWVGELGMMRPGPSSATVRAIQATEAFALRHTALRDLLDGAPSKAAARLMLRLAQRIALRVREASAVKFETNEAGHAELQCLLGPSEARLGEIPTGLATMPHRGSNLGASAPRTAEKRLVEALRREPELAPLDPIALEALARSVYLCVCEKDTVLIEQGTVADGAYFLLDGSAVVTADRDGSDYAIDRVLQPGHLFGQIAFLLSGKRTATVRLAERATVAVFYSAAITWLEGSGAAGGRMGLRVLHWMAAELADDVRAQNERILAAWAARA